MAEQSPDVQIVKWVFGKRDEGMTEEQIARSLEESGWKPKDVAMIMGAPTPTRPKKSGNMLKVMYSSIVVFSLLVIIMVLVGFGVIFDGSVAFTAEACQKQELPETACQTLQSMTAAESSENWFSPIASQGQDDAVPTGLELDLNTWIKSEVVNIESATICGAVDESLYLVVMSELKDRWWVDAILAIGAEGSSENQSYCQSHL